MESLIPKKYQCFNNLFYDLKDIDDAFAQIKYNTGIQNKWIENQSIYQDEVNKNESIHLINQMIENLIQAREQIPQNVEIDKNALNTTMASLLGNFMKDNTIGFELTSSVSNSTVALANNQQQLSDSIQQM